MAIASPRSGMESVAPATVRQPALGLVPRPVQHHALSAPLGQHLCLALARPVADGQYETLALNPGEPIRDLTMKLTNRGWFSGKSCIVFGDRELADSVRLSDLVNASGKATPAYLHVFVKLSDVESVTMRTLMRELSLSNPVAAEQQLAATMMKAATTGTSLLALPCSTQAAGEQQPAVAAASEGVASVGIDELPASSSSSSSSTPFAAASGSDGAQDAFDSTTADCDSHSRAVVHLCIHKSAKVNWHHMSENRFELSISSSDTVDSLMRKIEAANGIALEPGTVLIDGQPLSAGQPLAAYGISKGITKLELVPLEPLPDRDDAEALPDGSPSLASPAHGLHQHWKAARAGLAEGLAPTLAKAGTGGSYFLQDVSGRPVAVFKPEDEEPLAINNPKGRTPGSSGDLAGSSSGSSLSGSSLAGSSRGSEGLRRGTKPGEGAVREVAAYVLDHGHFSGVPPTALVSAYVSEDNSSSGTGGAVKVGSLQQFVESEGDCEERGYSGFPVQEVHKIAVLDLRLGNADRNAGNILARRKADGSQSWELIPIDHGYCLPASFEDLSFEWMYWPQAEQPFSEATLAYIAGLDADRDIATLAAHGITLRPECERVFRACTLTLQKGAVAGLTPSQIAGILCREGLTKSVIEKLHSNAMQLARAGASAVGDVRVSVVPQALYLQKLGALLDEYLEDYLLECADLLY